MAKRKDKTGRISVFKGREAKLNREIFHILALKGPLTAYDIHKQVRRRRKFRYTHYASVNKRVRSLEELDYIKRVGVKRTKAGFKATVYELATKAYLALQLNSVDLEEFLKRVDDEIASAILAAIAYTT